MTFLYLMIHLILFFVLIIIYLILAALVYLSSGCNFRRARPILTKVVSIVSRSALRLFGVKIKFHCDHFLLEENYLIVSNHLSYLDVLIISSLFPTCFVTSHEMKETPFLGQLCLLGGCLFVERRSRSGIRGEVGELSDALLSGLNVVIFPEATSSNGEKLLNFKRPLFQSAINTHSKVLLLCLNYQKIDDEKITINNRDKIFWYGDMSFFSHAMALLAHKEITVRLDLIDVLNTAHFSDKNELAQVAFEKIHSHYETIG